MLQAGIPEHWVMDLRGRRLHRHRNPVADVYETVDSFTSSEAVTAPGRFDCVSIESLLR